MKNLLKTITIFILTGLVLFSSLSARPAQARTLEDFTLGADPAQITNTYQFSPEILFGALGGFVCFSAPLCYGSDGEPIYGTTALETGSKALAGLVTQPPVQTKQYIAYQAQSLGLAQPAYAQGIGFSSLGPVLPLWKAFRNISYFMFILVFVGVGFMVMFRQTIDPQTMVTVQSALPKMVITLILITFSYAIAGFVVDMIYFLIYIFTGVLEAFDVINSANDARNVIFNRSIIRIGFSYFIGTNEVAGSAAQSISSLIQGSVGIPNFLGVFDIILDIIVYVIIIIAILWALFKTILSLIMSYVSIILSVIFAPLSLLANAWPGSNSFGSWIRNIAANALVFPAVAILVIIGAVLSGGTGNDIDDFTGIQPSATYAGPGFGEGGGFVPPLVTSRGSNIGLSDEEEFGIEHIQALIGIGIIMMLPEVAKVIKEGLGVKGLEVAEAAFSPITKPLGTIASVGGGAALELGSKSLIRGGANWFRGGGLQRTLGKAKRRTGTTTANTKTDATEVRDQPNIPTGSGY
jgi:hypothetical protein